MKKILLFLIVFTLPSIVLAQTNASDNLSKDIEQSVAKTVNPKSKADVTPPEIGTQVDTSIGKNVDRNEFNENYFVGLSAYDDGLYDVARISLQDFLKKDTSSLQSQFATYILYQVLMKENDFENARAQLYKAMDILDERFDRRKMQIDELYLTGKIDCSEAARLLMKTVDDELVMVFSASGCPITAQVGEFVARNKFSPETMLFTIDKAKDNKDVLVTIYENLTPDKRTAKILNFYGHYFAINKMEKEFWTLYNEYKDEDMVLLALNDIWGKEDYLRYYNLFNTDVNKDYKLNSNSFCRLIESANKTGNNFNCDFVDGCLGTTNVDFKKTKLACYMKNNDKEGINIFMKTVADNEISPLCDYGKYIISEKLYDISFVPKFSSCTDRRVMYETLAQHNDWAALEAMAENSAKTEMDYAFLSIAAKKLGKPVAANSYLAEISSPVLINFVKTFTGAK